MPNTSSYEPVLGASELRRQLRRGTSLVRAAWASRKNTAPFASADVAFMRALGASEADPALRNQDTWARHFLLHQHQLALMVAPIARVVSEQLMPGAYGYINARTKRVDALLAREATSGIEQFVSLGAGNDSRAFRIPALKGKQCFEVDLAETQRRKRGVLRRFSRTAERAVHFVEMDFERDALSDRLLAAGFDPTKKTFFNWEGVCMYLTAAAAGQLLSEVHSVAAPGSSIVFDYCLRSYLEGDHKTTHGGQHLARWLRQNHLEYRLGFNAGEVAAFLARYGFSVDSEWGPEELEWHYLRGSNGRVKRRMWGNFRIVHARVGGTAAANALR